MSIQQVVRFRLGSQGVNAGYQIAAASEKVSLDMEEQFKGMYTTVQTSASLDGILPYTLDCGWDVAKKNFYMTQIYPMFSGGRRTPYCHGIILDEKEVVRYFSQPEKFFMFSENNFTPALNEHQTEKKVLPQLINLKMEEGSLSVKVLREKYNLDDKKFESLIRHMYEAVFSENGTGLVFGWNQPLDTFARVIKDMMYLAFTTMPLNLRRRITFSNYQIQGLSTRMFTVVPQKECEQNQGTWFDLVTGNSSPLQENEDGTKFKTKYISYIVTAEDEERKAFLDYMENFIVQVFKRPEIKLTPAIASVMMASFYAYSDNVIKTYLKASEAGKVLNAIVRIKADMFEPISQTAGKVLTYANDVEAKINDFQFKNLQKYYLFTDCAEYEKAFVKALATREKKAVKTLFVEALKEKSSKKTDNFIAGLLEQIDNREEILTSEVIDALRERYPITESEELEDFYLDYIREKFTPNMSEKDTGVLVSSATTFLEESIGKPVYERAAVLMDRQVQKLLEYQLILDDTTLLGLLNCSIKCPEDFKLPELILKYYMDVYMTRPVEEAIRHYDLIAKKANEFSKYVNKELKGNNSDVLDQWYAKKRFADHVEVGLKTPEDYKKALDMVAKFGICIASKECILSSFTNKLKKQLAAKVEETDEKGKKSSKKNSKKEEDEDNGINLKFDVLYERVKKIFEEINQIYPEECHERQEMKEDILYNFWDIINLLSIKEDNFEYDFSNVKINHPKCESAEKYYIALKTFRNQLAQEVEYEPDEETIKALTTTIYLDSMKILDKRLKTIIEKAKIDDSALSFDVLLMKYYDFVEQKLIQTDFMKKISDNQKKQSEDSLILMMNENLEKEVTHHLGKIRKKASKQEAKEAKKKNKFSKEKSNKKKGGFILVGIAMTIVIISISVIIWFRFQDIKEKVKEPENKTQIETNTGNENSDYSDKDQDNKTDKIVTDKKAEDQKEMDQTEETNQTEGTGQTEEMNQTEGMGQTEGTNQTEGTDQTEETQKEDTEKTKENQEKQEEENLEKTEPNKSKVENVESHKTELEDKESENQEFEKNQKTEKNVDLPTDSEKTN